jgi:hypothetical protein
MGKVEDKTAGRVEVYVPTGGTDSGHKKLARRLESVRGARIGLLDNCKEFSDVVLKGVGKILKRDYQVGEVTFWRKGSGVPAPASLLAKMAESCDAVINGVGH